MDSFSDPGSADIVEPYWVPDTFVEGCAAIEETDGGCIRYTLYATRKGAGGQRERHVVVRLIYTRAVAEIINIQSRAFLNGDPGPQPNSPQPFKPRLVR